MVQKRSKHKKGNGFLNILSFIAAAVMFYGSCSSFLQSDDGGHKFIPKSTIEETLDFTIIGDSLSPDTLITHIRHWQNYANDGYEGSVQILASEVRAAEQHRDELDIVLYSAMEWGRLYQELVSFKGSQLDRILLMLDSIRVAHNLPMRDFAEVIVCFVQDIPYTYVLSDACKDRYLLDESFQKMVDKGTECYGKIKYGVNTPAEFMSSLHGDCDTRTVILYKIMSHFGFDVAILGSSFYAHSILGINMPGTGDYIPYRGKKYYVWETTNTGWQPGQIPPNNSSLSYWGVDLASVIN